MKKRTIICLSILFVLIITTVIILITNKKEKQFYLEDNYYGTNKITEVQMEELNQLIKNKESFVVFVYQPMCITSSDFESVLNDFLEEEQISIYKIAFSNIKDTVIGKRVRYYPSFIIYHKGKIVDFLEADKNEDVNYYTSKEEFGNWFTKYIKLRKKSSNDIQATENNPIEEENNKLEDVDLENVVREADKVNIYFFWGNGCPHCEQELTFFENIKEKYQDHYNLYTFETWYNEKNKKLLYTFAESMGDKVTGIPYTIIGNKSFTGFSEKSKNDFIRAIEEQYKNSYDVYFDKIKK